ncbi:MULTISPECIES: low molecular weight protein-tyrosine-phosphatase [Rhodovulum]|uniref:protein-tyrosine-phosphatase n=2 Tax=Rhodovulum TaxID=34008 RepID=A0A4R8FD56_9RHOB|nr:MULTISPECIES: low molecular weight protein-tyrosine-phosphatase [Rhodovulum]PTW50911.1 protein-tyrosine phosphatase [Rhodovulum kholense]TDX21628.1 protein-tyrosine phosphatase [Rhodovulum visakhapatnamense]
MTTRILFVCLGNICRSPTAHGVFQTLAEAEGLAVEVESAGTGGWHVGDPPDPRAIRAAAGRGYDLTALRARQVKAADFAAYDLILAMDRSNLTALERMRPIDSETPVRLFLDFADADRDELPDPYYDGSFDLVLDLVEDASRGLIRHLAG